MSEQQNAPPPGWLRMYRPAWGSLAFLVGATGVAGLWLEVGAGPALFLIAGLAVPGTFGFWQFGPQQGDGRPDLRCLVVGAGSSLGFLALAGLGYEWGPAGFASGVVIAAAGWPLVRRPRAAAARGRAGAQAALPPGPARESVPASGLPDSGTLRGLSTPQLCWTWRASYGYLCMCRWPSDLDCLADLRRQCLDELERRDPVAFAHWFPTARAASDPARYFCGQSQP